MTTKILIIGAGPTGLTAALELIRRGIHVRIIDRRNEARDHSQSLAIHARTMELLDNINIIDDVFEDGLQIPKADLYDNGQQFGQIDFSKIDSNFPFIFALPQQKLEAALLNKLAENGVTPEWSTSCREVSEGSDQVQVSLAHDGESQQLSFDFVLACDGIHSDVREALEIKLAKNSHTRMVVNADLKMTSSLEVGVAHTFFHEQGTLSLVPMQDMTRVIIDVTRQQKQLPEKLSLFDFDKLFKKRKIAVSLEKILWQHTTLLQQTYAQQFQKGRVFLLGHAAQQHSPFSGQALNTGILDAFNLCWKLADVIHGFASPKLLKTYEQERLAIAKQVHKNSMQAIKASKVKAIIFRWLRNKFIKKILTEPQYNLKFARGIAQVAHQYPVSSSIDKMQPKHGPRVGTRAYINEMLQPYMQGTKSVLLIFTQGIVDDLMNNQLEILNTVLRRYPAIQPLIIGLDERLNSPFEQFYDISGEQHKLFGISKPGICLVRPDWVIAGRLDTIEAEQISLLLQQLNFTQQK